MEFKEFAGRLKTIIGGKDNTVKFTRTLFLTMMNEDGEELLKDTKDNTMKSYFNGQTKITRIASLILAHLNDGFEFAEFLNSFGESTIQLIADAFSDIVPDINTSNAAEKLEELFLDILKSAAEKKKALQRVRKIKMVILQVWLLKNKNYICLKSIPQTISPILMMTYCYLKNLQMTMIQLWLQ